MRLFIVMLSLFCIGAASSADGELQFAEFEECQLTSGLSIANCRIGYRTNSTT